MPKKPTKSLAETLRKGGATLPKKRMEPFWKGPEVDGITFSMLNRFLACRERFRVTVIEGLKPVPTFSARMEYGNMWHVCEEALAANVDYLPPLRDYARKLALEYPTQQFDIDKWYNVCKLQFPLYVDFWHKHEQVKGRTPILQEGVFRVPYKIPGGRVVTLRGKWDSVDSIKMKEKHLSGIWLQENKTKSDIREEQLKRQLKCDLQSMLYIVALVHTPEFSAFDKVRGIRYNVIRRPLAGGKGTIVQHKPTKKNPAGESKEAYYNRLRDDYIAAEPETYFMRWMVEVPPRDILTFKREVLDPLLESLWDWWEVVRDCSDPFLKASPHHYRTPFGIYNPITEAGCTDLDNYLDTGSEVGLQRVKTLFGELE